jgi:hypothetical protein
MTIVYFDNEAHTPQGNGWLEVCKDRALLDYNQYDWAVYGNFHFTIQDAAGATYERDVLAGQCSEPIEVAAGIARVTEAKRDGIDLVDAWTLPEDRFQGSNLLNGTVDVEVPVSSDPNDETQVHFVNKAQRAQLKVCKALGGPGASALVGVPFYFNVAVDGYMKTLAREFKIVAGATTQCKIWGDVTLGTEVEVTEDLDHGVGQLGEFIDTTGEGTITIKPGINTITITNTPVGQLEICKAKIQYSDRYSHKTSLNDAAQPWFNFLVDGKTKVTVRAGRCAPPLRVSIGQHTIVEQSYVRSVNNVPTGSAISMSSSASDYELDTGGTVDVPLLGSIPYSTPGDGIDVTPNYNSSFGLISKNLNTRTVTVAVPYGPNGETLVTYYNRIRKGRIKICKQIPYTSQDSLGGKPFNFNWTVDGQRGTVTLVPGECSYVLGESNIIDANGLPTPVTVVESGTGMNTNWVVGSIGVQFSRDNVNINLMTGTVTFNLGPDTNVVTYTNKSIDP